jgi:RHS repeat-associated protein
VTPPVGGPIAYVVDGENRRVGKQVNGTVTQGFLYKDAVNVVVQLDGSGNVVNRFVFASKRNVPDYFTSSAGTFRILSDHLGSPRLIANTSTGSVVQEIDYDEFGNVTSDTSPGLTPFGFAGGLYDKDTGLVRFGARDYDASVGRWTAKDPSGFAGGQINLYVYGGNDPVNEQDPNGRTDWGPFGGSCCNGTNDVEWTITGNCDWTPIGPGQCSGVNEDCDAITCNGVFYKIRNYEAATCTDSSSGLGATTWWGSSYAIGPDRGWSPTCGGGANASDISGICGGSNDNQPAYDWASCQCQ